MSTGMRVQAKVKDGETTLKALINHPMETGQRKDSKTGQLVPAHFIEEVLCELNGKMVMRADWSGGISKNPYLSIKFTGANEGDKVVVSWKDNKGESDSVEATIK